MRIQTPKALRPFTVYVNGKPPREKIVIKINEWDIHYTIMLGSNKRKLNIHRTNENYKSKKDKYRSIITIRYFTIGRILVYLKHSVPLLFQYYIANKTLNLGKLKKNKFIFFPLDGNEEHIAKAFVETKNKLRIVKHFEIPNPLDSFLEPDKIMSCKQKTFMAYQMCKGKLLWKGYVLKNLYKPNSKKLHYIPNKVIASLLKDQNYLLFEILNAVKFKGKKRLLKDFEEHLLLKDEKIA